MSTATTTSRDRGDPHTGLTKLRSPIPHSSAHGPARAFAGAGVAHRRKLSSGKSGVRMNQHRDGPPQQPPPTDVSLENRT